MPCNHPRRRAQIGVLLWAIGWCWLAMPTVFAADRPNMILFLTDDQRADALGCAGNTVIKTPHIDRLASEGLRFRNMFTTNALCSPSRATILTGLYSHSHGVMDNGENRKFKPGQVLVSDLLRGAGYEVAFCGKSHIEGALRDHKWDYYFGYHGQGTYHNPKIAEGVDGKNEPRTGYIDDIVTDKAIDWLKTRSTNKPFCLFVWFKAPHRSWIRPRRHMDLYSGVTIPKPATFDDDLRGYPGKPEAFLHADNKIGDFDDVRTLEGFLKDYYAVITAVDDNVGRVTETLRELGTLDDTAVLFSSDNGFFAGEWRMFDKRFMHEPSIRVPLVVRYPKMIRAGTTCDRMVLNLDLGETLLDLAGVPVPDWMQGRSLTPLFKDQTAEWRKDWLYEYFEYPLSHRVRKQRGIRSERYKYIHYFEEPQDYELYDLQADPQELKNLYGKPAYAELTRQLRARMEELRRETYDPTDPPVQNANP